MASGVTIERGSDRAVAAMEAARRAGLSAGSRLVLMARRMVSDPQPTQRQLMVEMFTAARRDADAAERVAAALGSMEHELARLMERARADGDIADGWDADVLARFCLSVRRRLPQPEDGGARGPGSGPLVGPGAPARGSPRGAAAGIDDSDSGLLLALWLRASPVLVGSDSVRREIDLPWRPATGPVQMFRPHPGPPSTGTR